MKILIYVFSGTGNTLKIAQRYQEEFKPHETTIYMIDSKNKDIVDPYAYDIIGLGYPIHAFNAPEVFYHFVKSLPELKKQSRKIPTFIFKTSGEPLALNNSSSQQIVRCLTKKGYNVLLERHYIMPYNIIFRHDEAFVKQMWIYAQALVRVNAKEILAFKKEKVKKIFFKQIHTFIFRIEWLYAKIQGPSYKVDYDKCIRCNQCINKCPTNNIVIEKDKYKFNHHCSLCMRCAFLCPTNAISIGLLNNWKVNGDYHLENTVDNIDLAFPSLQTLSKKMQKVYIKYFKKADQYLAKNKVDLHDFYK